MHIFERADAVAVAALRLWILHLLQFILLECDFFLLHQKLYFIISFKNHTSPFLYMKSHLSHYQLTITLKYL